MKLLLCIVTVLVAFAMVDADDDDSRSPRSPQQRRRHFGGGAGFGGINPGFGGVNPGFGGVNPGFGGVSPGFGGVNPGFGGGFNSNCRYFCRSPQGQYICCGNTNQQIKPGQCPPVRPVCPRVFGPPVTCFSDASCAGADKCCFDRCLGERVCKPPLGFGR